MKQELTIGETYNFVQVRESYDFDQERVILHLQWTDFLLVFLPMTLIVVLGGIIPFTNAINMGDPVTLVFALIDLIASFIFSFIYEFLALILSFVTRRNSTFRIALVGFISVGVIFCARFFG